MFIQQLDFIADIKQIQKDLNIILTKVDWFPEQQIGLTYRKNALDPWKDSAGSLYDRKNKIELNRESDFTEFNIETPKYLTSILEKFCKFQNIELGRARFMNLVPNTGLSVHRDTSVRYHLVVKTNPHAYIGHTFNVGNVSSLCFNLPANGHFYKVDTTKEHFVYNGGSENRIHLVISPK